MRWPLWLPACLGLGIGGYFLLPAEPPSWLGMAAMGNVALLAFAFRGRAGAVPLVAAGFACALGFAAAQARTQWVAAPVLPKRMAAEITGRIAEMEARDGIVRAVIERVNVAGLDPAATPTRIRLRFPGADGTLFPGQWIAVRAMLMPPSGPVAPGEFDFQRHLYFQGIGATGFALAPAARVIDTPTGAERRGFALWLETVRERTHRRILVALAGTDSAVGAIASALVTGKQGAIPGDVLKAMRDSGLAHLLAISGQNISLVAGFVFVLLRGAAALVPALALRRPIKKWAAIAAFFSALAYLLISGSSVPTQRAVAMIGFVVLAVLVDRAAMSMRLVAWASCAVLLIAPEALLGPSFQLSFAAVIALIAGYERLPGGTGAWVHRGTQPPGPSGRAWRYLVLIFMSSAIASAATAPYAIYHFNRFSLYGLGANLLAVPLTGIWIMPWGLAAMLLFPFGLESWALVPMGWGIEAMIGLAREVASWPSASLVLPSLSRGGILAVSVGGLWLCIWQRRWRLAGLAPILGGLLSVHMASPPDVLASGDGKLVAVRAPDGTLALSTLRGGKYAAEKWLLESGQTEAAPWTIREVPEGTDWLACDAQACLYRAKGQVVALVRDGAALAEDCAAARVVVAEFKAPASCRTTAAVVDSVDLWREGTHAIWLLGDGGVRIESVRGRQGERPWVPKPGGPPRLRPATNED